MSEGKAFLVRRTVAGGYAGLTKSGQPGLRRSLCGILPILVAVLCLGMPLAMRAQTTAQLTGTVQDPSGAIIPNAQMTLTNEATQASRTVETNGEGLYAFPSLVPGSYTLKAEAKGFQSKELTGIVLNAGDNRTVAALVLTVGSEATTVTVSASAVMIPVDNGQRTDVISNKEIENLALEGRDVTELLKVLPGATTMSGGLTQTSPQFSDLDITVQQSAVGNGININGVPNRGGTSLLADGVNVIDPGNMASSVSIINPDMTQEVTVQTADFNATVPYGPVVVSAISKSGGAHYHGEAYFDARNDALNANDWQDNHNGVGKGGAHYYYPGGNFGGPVPLTHTHLFFWGGYERWLQNQGNANVLKSAIPTPEMMAGDFTTDNADNMAACPSGFSSTITGQWCNDISDMVLPDGSSPTPAPAGDTGASIPSKFLDPGAAALAKIWPKANANPTQTGGYNYYEPIPNVNDGWMYRFRIDYNLGSNTKIYGAYQQAYNSDLASGNGAHLYWTPGDAIPFPGGGEQQVFRGKSLVGHIVHNFGSSATNDLMAGWAFGSFPFAEPNPSAALRSTLGYPSTYAKVFSNTPVLNIPAYNSPGGPNDFPDFSQNSIFDNPPGQYAVRKEAPQFSDVFTRVWRTHTIELGGYDQTTDNFQSTFATYEDGDFSSFNGENPDVNTGNELGSPNNPVANFVTGIADGYSESNSSPIADTAYQSIAVFVDDTWKASSHLTLEGGARIEHVGHWYDRDGTGMAVFIPQDVAPDFQSGRYAPGYRWHATDPGIPLSGQPNRFAFVSPRFGLSYDLFGNGNTVIRGGWGAYRFVTQTNDVASALTTAQDVLGYSLPGGKAVQFSEIGTGNAVYKQTCTSQCVQGSSQTGFDPTDYGQPLTYAWNFTIDQRVPWNSLVDVAYVGNVASQLSDDSEDLQGSNFSAVADQNKMPMGALFKPDPITGVTALNPEDVTTQPNGTKTGNSYADYHPYGIAYGTNSVYMIQSTDYNNYHGLQASWIKTTGRFTFDFNGTWSKALGTGLQENPYNVNLNYGPTSIDRPFVFNASYTYASGRLHTGNDLVNQLGGGWTISGISTWQHGGYIPAELGNNVPNFGMGLQYINYPAGLSSKSALSAKTYFGTDSSIPILPMVTCNPQSGLGHNQILNLSCFNAPAVGSQGGQKFPYMATTPYYDNDLAVYRTFHVREEQNLQFRFSAFDWLNHSLPEFANSDYYSLAYNVDYNTHAITPNNANYISNIGSPANWGYMTVKSQAPYERILEMDLKYFF